MTLVNVCGDNDLAKPGRANIQRPRHFGERLSARVRGLPDGCLEWWACRKLSA